MSGRLTSDLASLQLDRSQTDGPHRSSSGLRFATRGAVVFGALALVGWGTWTAARKYDVFRAREHVKTSEIILLSPSQAEVQLTAAGYVVPQHTSKVGAKIPGRINKVFVKEGDSVKEGDTIAQLDDVDQRSAKTATSTRVGAAQARVATARANLSEITQQVTRSRALVASGAIAKSQLDDLIARQGALAAQVQEAQAEVLGARADVSSIDVGLKDRLILAPMNGRIVSRPAAVGELVGPSGGEVAEIVDYTTLTVEADVPEARLLNVKVGGPCEIVLDAYPNKRYRGVVQQLGQRLNRAKGTLAVRVMFDDDLSGVLPEMSARVSFLSSRISDAALRDSPKRLVEADAVVERGGQKVVFAVDDEKLHVYPVRIGALTNGSFELIDGPPVGTKLVLRPSAQMSDGNSIKEHEK